MPVVVIEAAAPVGSWRPPEALTYHRTLPLPPYTTLVGLLGAALGLGLPDTYRFFTEGGLRIGVGGWHEGELRDLWKFQKLGDKEVKADVLLRECWTDVRLALVVETPEDKTATTVANAFNSPAYPLTAGPSDALLKAVAVRVEDVQPIATRVLVHALIFREISPHYELHESLLEIPFHRAIRAPAIERLPVGFAFEPDGRRRLVGRDMVSFVADAIRLAEDDEAIVGYLVEPHSQILRRSRTFSTWKDGLKWIIPVHRYDLTPTQVEGSSTKHSPSGQRLRKGKRDKPTENT